VKHCTRIVRGERAAGTPASSTAFVAGLARAGRDFSFEGWMCRLQSTVTLFTSGDDPEPLSGAWS
jgi:hypothetical protein